jgi:predicted glycosyltransferase
VKIWVDVANSPHVPLFVPVVRRLRDAGHDVVLTARDHAQTLPLATDAWDGVRVIGGQSAAGRARKAAGIGLRALELRRFARRAKPDVALSHGSYAQIAGAYAARVPAVTMMDYEHQPANHLSFRLARRVIVPVTFPDDSLKRFGARPGKVVRYEGFKEELYLSELDRGTAVLDDLGVRREAVVAVLRPPPEGALYHRGGNDRFEEVMTFLERHEEVEIVLLPRGAEQQARYAGRRVTVPERPVDGTALLAAADLVVGGGGTMTREAALLETPTYTVFLAELAAVDAELIRRGLIVDLREPGLQPAVEKRGEAARRGAREQSDAIYQVILRTLHDVVRAAR